MNRVKRLFYEFMGLNKIIHNKQNEFVETNFMIISPLQGFIFGGYVNPGFRSLRSLSLGYKNVAPTELRNPGYDFILENGAGVRTSLLPRKAERRKELKVAVNQQKFVKKRLSFI